MSNESADRPPVGSYDVVIRRASDGVERVYRFNVDWPADGNQFWWEDGNGACDCNRGDFFERAGGNDQPDSVCGDSRYLVMAFLLPDGSRVNGPDS